MIPEDALDGGDGEAAPYAQVLEVTRSHSVRDYLAQHRAVVFGIDASFRATVVLPAPNAPFSQITCGFGMLTVCYDISPWRLRTAA